MEINKQIYICLGQKNGVKFVCRGNQMESNFNPENIKCCYSDLFEPKEKMDEEVAKGEFLSMQEGHWQPYIK